MFGGRFSHTRFSLRGEVELDARIDVMFIESIRNLISVGQDSYVESNFREQVRSDILLIAGTPFSCVFNENITAVVIGVRDYDFDLSYNETIQFDIVGGAIEFAETMIYNAVINSHLFTMVADTTVEPLFISQIMNQSEGGVDFAIDLPLEEVINADVFLTIASAIELIFNEIISADLYLSNNVNMLTDFIEQITGLTYMGNNITWNNNFVERIQQSATGALDMPFSINVKEAIFMLSQANTTDKDSMVIDVLIPPGGELRIDSEHFTVTLDGHNIIHLHDGDFVNISRETLDMFIASDGDLEGELIYVERYL